jgi:hypothetical protein
VRNRQVRGPRKSAFFRLAFSGKLGEEFAIEKLEALMVATAPAAIGAPARTPRWNVRPAQQESRLAAMLNAQLTQAILQVDPAYKAVDLEESLTDSAILRGLGKQLGNRAQALGAKLTAPAGDKDAGARRAAAAALGTVCDLLAENLDHLAKHEEEESALLKRRKPDDGWRADWEKHWSHFFDWHAAWSRRWVAATVALEKAIPAPAQSDPDAEPARDPSDRLAVLRPAARVVAILAPPMEIRRALGVIHDEKFAAEERGAPLPRLD